jgi:hypothetical protein
VSAAGQSSNVTLSATSAVTGVDFVLELPEEHDGKEGRKQAERK